MSVFTSYALFVYLIIGTISAYLANREGKNPYLWFTLGVFFGIFAIIILFFLKHKKQKKAPLKKTLKPSLAIIQDSRFWYYLDKKNIKFGPVSFHKLQNLWHEKKISSHTYVWTENFKDWKPLKTIKEYEFFQKNNLPT